MQRNFHLRSSNFLTRLSTLEFINMMFLTTELMTDLICMKIRVTSALGMNEMAILLLMKYTKYVVVVIDRITPYNARNSFHAKIWLRSRARIPCTICQTSIYATPLTYSPPRPDYRNFTELFPNFTIGHILNFHISFKFVQSKV